MKLSEAFPGKWLKAEDFEDGDAIVTIKSAEVEEIKGNNGTDKKLVLRFREFDRGLICNKVNGKSIAKLHGDDTDEWVGKKIALFATEVQFGDEMVPGIRVRSKLPAAAKAAKAAPAPVADEDDDDSDIPF